MQYDDVLIKLSDCHNVTKKDNKVLEFCSGISDLRSMCDKGTLDFIVTSLYSFE